ncbi:putative alpha/beta hydrolase [Aspergillus recurvatus]
MDFRLVLVITVLSAPLTVFLYRQIRSSLEDIQYTPEEHTFTPARTGPAEQEGQTFSKPVYRIDAFPGNRQFRTIYGTIHVFEWGPEDGEKVLLVHGLGTPCIALGGMAKELVRKGYRVMIYDLFGRGYSDAPNDLVFDARLYTTQVLLVLSSSPLPWTGTSAFHIIGFSLGGSIAVAFAAYHATMLRSVTLVCPGGLIRTSHMKPLDRVLYSTAKVIPEWLRLKIFRDSLEPRNGAACADVLGGKEDEDDLAFDDVPIAEDRPQVSVGDVIRWQLGANAGFVRSYLSTLRSALVYRRHDRTWRVLADELARRREVDALPGLPGGKVCLIVAERDIIVVGDECASDAAEILGTEAVETHVLSGGHEIAISRSRDVISIATGFWNKQ